ESNGMSEAFVGTFRRDYVEAAGLGSAESVVRQFEGWFRDYNEVAPHSALGMKSPAEFRREQTLTACAFSKFCRGFSLNFVASGAGVWGSGAPAPALRTASSLW